MILDYQKYRAVDEAQKLGNLLHIDFSIANLDAKQAKQFLGSLLNDKRESSYNRRKSLEIIARLTLLNKIGVEGTIDKLLDIEVTEDHFIILQAIKFSHHFYKKFKNEIIEWLTTFSLHTDPEIRSESYFALGRIHFIIGVGHFEQIEFSSLLIVANEYFTKSYKEIENRIDALLFSNLSSFLLEILRPEKENLELLYKSAETNLKKYIFYSLSSSHLSIFVNLVECLNSIKNIATSQPDTWLDFRKELNEILIEMYKIEALALCNDFINGSSVENEVASIRDHLLNNILIDKFQLEIKKLRKLSLDNLTSLEQKELITRIIDLIDLSQNPKKNISLNTELLIKLRSTFPSIPLETIKIDLKSLDSENIVGITDIFLRYSNVSRSFMGNILTTGYSQGDEILDIISSRIREFLPNYPLEKFVEFGFVLRDIVNFFINSVRGDKTRFGFLFKTNALEVELQQSMLSYLQVGPRAGLYISEVKEFADGGRADIVYNSPRMQLPIELKRSIESLSWDEIENKFIGQAQSYAYSRDLISFFVLLDLSPQSPNRPESDIRSLFKIISLSPRQNLESEISNYVIAFIIPGNKVNPSERSK